MKNLRALKRVLLTTVSLFVWVMCDRVDHASAAVEAESVVRQYDDSRTQVTSPSIDVSGTFDNDQMKVSAGWAQDIVTSASADVTSYASKGVIRDKRTEYSTSLETLIPDGTMSVGYIQSDENDYHSKTFSAGGTREFFQKNTVMSFGFANGNDRINSSSNLEFDERMRNQVYSLSLTQVLSRTSLAQLVYDFRVENGYIASPYRRAKFEDPTTGTITIRSENHPQTRNRNAIAFKYNHFSELLRGTFASTYRLYNDSWGVTSHTLEERYTREFTKRFQTSFTARYYTQTQANFYADYYTDANAVFYTGNNTLATFDGYMLSVRPAWQALDSLQVFGKLENYRQNFKNATDAGQPLTKSDDKKLEINAYVVELGLSAKF